MLGPSWTKREVYFGEGWLWLGGPCLGERFLFKDKTPDRVDYIGQSALVKLVAFFKNSDAFYR